MFQIGLRVHRLAGAALARALKMELGIDLRRAICKRVLVGGFFYGLHRVERLMYENASKARPRRMVQTAAAAQNAELLAH